MEGCTDRAALGTSQQPNSGEAAEVDAEDAATLRSQAEEDSTAVGQAEGERATAVPVEEAEAASG